MYRTVLVHFLSLLFLGAIGALLWLAVVFFQNGASFSNSISVAALVVLLSEGAYRITGQRELLRNLNYGVAGCAISGFVLGHDAMGILLCLLGATIGVFGGLRLWVESVTLLQGGVYLGPDDGERLGYIGGFSCLSRKWFLVLPQKRLLEDLGDASRWSAFVETCQKNPRLREWGMKDPQMGAKLLAEQF